MSNSNTKYYTSKDKKKTYAKVNAKPLINDIRQVFKSSNMSKKDKDNLFVLSDVFFSFDYDDYDYDECDTFVSHSTLQHDDVYDEYTGKRIAVLKADEKYHTKRYKQCKVLLKTVKKCEDVINKVMNKHLSSIVNINKILCNDYGFDKNKNKYDNI